jgi:pyruvate dehydrogenase E1 component alpha subunit
MRFTKHLLQAEVLNEEQAQAVDAQAEQVILKAVEFAEASPEPDLSTLMDYIYA